MVIEPVTPEHAAIVLAEVLEQGCLAEVYTGDEDRFSVGLVDALSETHVRLRSLDAGGHAVGIEVRGLADVTRVETGSEYLRRRVEPLARYRRTSPAWPRQRLVGKNPDLVMDALELSMADRNAVTLWLKDTRQHTGPVVKLTDDAGSIADLDEYGELDREVPFRVAGVVALDYGCEHERVVQFLSRRCGGSTAGGDGG